MSSTTLPVCPKTGSTSPSLTVHLCLHTALLREIGNAPAMRLGLLPRDMKALADEEMLLILEEDGMSGARRWFWKLGLKVPYFSAKATKPISGQVYAPCP